jgi:carbamoyltransferase
MSKNIVLGIHAGHDASASVFVNGRLESSILQERQSRIRHDFGINIHTIDLAVKEAGVKQTDINFVGLTSTQQMPLVIQTPQDFNFNSEATIEKESKWLHGYDFETNKLIIADFIPNNFDEELSTFIKTVLHGIRKIPIELLNKSNFKIIADPLFIGSNKADNLGLTETIKALPALNINAQKLGLPIQVRLRDQKLKGFYWSHHACHAASNAYVHRQERLIITHDGGHGFQSGGVWKFKDGQLNLIKLHGLSLGWIYDFFAYKLGLGHVGGAGKLMGLAAYGSGLIPLDENICGNQVDVMKGLKIEQDASDENLADKLFDNCIFYLSDKGIDTSKVGDSNFVLGQAQREIAFYIQKFVEISMKKLVEHYCEDNISNFGFSGGFALNCPTNSKIYNELNLNSLIIEPHCEDGGCSIGAAALSSYKKTNQFPDHKAKLLNSEYAYYGALTSRKSLKFKSKHKEVKFRAIHRTAELLIENKIVAVFNGRSEIGPRALGHRSILANPKFKENWNRVNRVKQREEWRPFAPVVLQLDLFKYFELGPELSPFMLFNYKVKPEYVNELQAITHLDGTSRVQTVGETGFIFKLLSRLKRMGNHPVLLNTSLNGPGEPIIETPEEAIRFFESAEIDAIYINGTLYEK